MNEVLFILLIIMSVLGIGLIFSYIWKIIKMMWAVVGIFLTALFLFNIFIYYNASSFSSDFATGEKLIIVHDGTKVLSAIEGTLAEDETPKVIKNLNAISGEYEANNYKTSLQDHYKVVLIHTKIYAKVKQIELLDQNITRAEAIQYIRDDAALQSMLPPDVDLYDAKAAILMALTNEVFEKDPSVLIKGIKDGSIQIVEEPFFFQFLRYLPDSISEKIIKQ